MKGTRIITTMNQVEAIDTETGNMVGAAAFDHRGDRELVVKELFSWSDDEDDLEQRLLRKIKWHAFTHRLHVRAGDHLKKDECFPQLMKAGIAFVPYV